MPTSATPARPRRARRTLRSAAVSLGLASLLGIGGLLATPAAPAAAAAVVPCTTRATAQPFRAWGDANHYFTLPGGTFESAPTGWTLAGGAAIAPESNPWRVISAKNASSLRLPKGASAATPAFCVDPMEAQVRFFYKSPGVPNAYLVAKVTVVQSTGTYTGEYWMDGSAKGWQVTPILWLPSVMGAGQNSTVTVTFTQKITQAEWRIDDFQVDPWKSL